MAHTQHSLPLFNGLFGRILKRHASLMLNRHATSTINIQNAIKSQGQAGMIIRKCNHKHQTRLIARRRFPISGTSVSPVTCSGPAKENNVRKYTHLQFSTIYIWSALLLQSTFKSEYFLGSMIWLFFFNWEVATLGSAALLRTTPTSPAATVSVAALGGAVAQILLV